MLFGLLLFASLVGQETPQGLRPPQPQRAMWRLAKFGDYPASAKRAEEQGVVGYRAYVSVAGLVTACTVVMSSGSAALDAKTCDIVTRRARFAPALDAAGAATTGSFYGVARWVLPDRPIPAANWARIERYSANEDGTLTSCAVDDMGPVPHVGAFFYGCEVPLVYSPRSITMKVADRRRRSFVARIVHAVDGAPEPRFEPPVGAIVVTHRRFSFDVLPDGSATGCRILEIRGFSDTTWCVPRASYQRLPKDAPAVVRHVTRTETVWLVGN